MSNFPLALIDNDDGHSNGLRTTIFRGNSQAGARPAQAAVKQTRGWADRTDRVDQPQAWVEKPPDEIAQDQAKRLKREDD